MKTTDKKTKSFRLTFIVVAVIIPATLIFMWKFADRQFYLSSVIIMILAMVPVFARFEQKQPHAREIVTLAVMCAIAVIGRIAFIMVPNFSPILGIIMITGMALGPQSGFICGVISAFVSNFFFGQGPWTPWQMFAFGLGGLLMGLLVKKRHNGKILLDPEKRLTVSIAGAVMIMVLIGPLLDTGTVFIMSSMIGDSSVLAIYVAGIPINAIHAVATFLTLLVLCKPMCEKLDRIKVKYGIMNEI